MHREYGEATAEERARCTVIEVDESTPPDRLKIGDSVKVLEICDRLPNLRIKVGGVYQISPDSSLLPAHRPFGQICLWAQGISGARLTRKQRRSGGTRPS